MTSADRAEVLQGMKLTTPIMLFMLGLIVTLGCAFARDDVKRNRRGPRSQSRQLNIQGLESRTRVCP